MKKINVYITEKGCELIYPNMEGQNIDKVDFSNFAVYKCSSTFNLDNLEKEIYADQFTLLKENFYIFWLFKELEDGKYVEQYSELNKLISNIKNTYQFDFRNEPSKRKCMLCGRRNIIEQNELCPLCNYKRNYDNNKSYQSVYSIAIRDWKKVYSHELLKFENLINTRINKSKLDKYYNLMEIDKLITIFSDLTQKIDGQLTLNEVIDKYKTKYKHQVNQLDELRQDLIESDYTLNELIEDLKIFSDNLNDLYKVKSDEKNNNECIVEKPVYEYAFLKFDVDNLGKWMSGLYLEDIEYLSDNEFEKFQKDLSSALITLGLTLKDEFEKNSCDVIYAGGDDFLAVLPVAYIEKVSNIIEDKFRSIVLKGIESYYLKEDITYSMSITIAQCKDEMAYALMRNRLDLEMVKKEFFNHGERKSGVAITYIINNGKEINCYIKRNKLQEFYSLMDKYKKNKNKISLSFVNNLEQEFLMFDNKKMIQDEVRELKQIFLYELVRLMKRSSNGVDKDIEKFIDEVNNFMKNNFEDNRINLDSIKERRVNVKNICNVLRLIEKLYMKIGEVEKENATS